MHVNNGESASKDGDWERAYSVVNNICFNSYIKRRHPIFNKKSLEEPDIDL